MKKRPMDNWEIGPETSIDEVERQNPNFNERGCWLYIKRIFQEGDKICYAQNVHHIGRRVSGYGSIALVRDGKVIAECGTMIIG